MKHRVVAVVFAAGLLGGCSSSFLDNALEYPSLGQHKETATSEPAPEATVPATTPTVGAAPFVSVPEARALASTDQAHQTLRAGTTPPAAVAVQPRVPSEASAPPPAAPIAVAEVARTEIPPPIAPPSYTPPPPVAQPAPPARDEPPAAQPAPASMASAAPATGDDWCVRVAKSAQAEAAEQGFDAATQQRRSLAVFKQCSANAR